MSLRSTLVWLCLAAGLFAFIFFFERHLRPLTQGPARILPGLTARAVDSLQVRPAGKLELRAARTNGGWELTEPLVYPAQSDRIEALLTNLEQLTPAAYVPERDLKNRFNADEEFGFADPQSSIIVNQGAAIDRIRIGHKTAPGDQVFLQVVGVEGAYVVDAELLKFIPRAADDWRDTTLVDLRGLAFDRVSVTAGAKAFELQHDVTNQQWRIRPMEARADNARITDALQKLQQLQVCRFVSDDPRADLESFGLQPPELELALALGTNVVARLQFGKSPTNDASQLYARRVGGPTVVTVSKALVAPWRASVTELRDPHLLTLTAPVETIEVRGEDSFTLQRGPGDTWRILPLDLPADAGLVKDLLDDLTTMQIAEFVKGVVAVPDLPDYGLASPARQYILRAAPAPDAAAPATNSTLANLNFGATNQGKVFVRRTDETAIYAVSLAEAQKLPTASWQLRERKLWNFAVDDVVGVVIRQQGRENELIRKAAYSWSLAPGSQGMINDLAVEETVKGLVQASAEAWVARGDQSRAQYGFTDGGYQATLELKTGATATLEFGGQTPGGIPYAAITRDGEVWICEFPPALYLHTVGYLAAPPAPPKPAPGK